MDLADTDLADAPSLMRALQRELPGIVATTDSGDWYLFYDPDDVTDPAARFPFATLMTGDRYDAASHLDRSPSTYRVNVGVSRSSYEQLFGTAPRVPAGHEVIDTGHDYTAEDVFFPHPFYAPMHWLGVVNPSPATASQLAGFLSEAYAMARARYKV